MSTISADYTRESLYGMYATNLTSQTGQTSLSSDQKSKMEDILSEFDSSNLTTSDASSIVEAFSELGIRPSDELTSFLDELGFSANEIGDLAQSVSNTSMQSSMPPPPPPPSIQDELTSTLSELYEDDEDDESTISTNPYANDDTSTSFSNLLDYTSRILSLNEDSQQEVLDMFSEYNNSDDKASQASSVRENLSSILANQNNYASLSLYA